MTESSNNSSFSPSENRTGGKARMVAYHLAWLLPVLAVHLWFFGTQFQGLRLADAMDAAQVGRHVSEGRGFITSLLRPFSLALAPKVVGHPDLYNPPLYPLILAVVFNLGGADDRAVGLVATLFGLLTALVTYFIGARLLDWRAGALGALLISVSPGLLNASISGLNLTLIAFLVAVLFYLTLAHRGASHQSLLSGMICGLSCLAEYAAAVFAFPVAALVLVGQRENRVRHVALFFVGFMLLVLPWLVRTWAVTGSPLGSLKAYSVAMYGVSHPGASLYRMPEPGDICPVRFVMQHPREVARKTLVNLGSLESALPAAYGLVLVPLLALSLFLDLGSSTANRLKWTVLAAAALLAVTLAASEPRFDMFYVLLGPVAALGGAGFVQALSVRVLSSKAIAAATAAILILSAFPLALTALPGAPSEKPDRRNLDYLARALPADAVVLTDQPWAVAWYSNRMAVWIPRAPSPRPRVGTTIRLSEAADPTRDRSFAALEKMGVKPDAIHLSAQLQTYAANEEIGRWQLLHGLMARQVEALQRGEAKGEIWVPPGWTLAATLPPMDFMLLRAEPARPAIKFGRSG